MTRPQMLAVVGIAGILETLLYITLYSWILGGFPISGQDKFFLVFIWFYIVPGLTFGSLKVVQWAVKPND